MIVGDFWMVALTYGMFRVLVLGRHLTCARPVGSQEVEAGKLLQWKEKTIIIFRLLSL